MARKTDDKRAKEYERKIQNLLVYQNPETRNMATRLLLEAMRDSKVSTKQRKRLERLFKAQIAAPP